MKLQKDNILFQKIFMFIDAEFATQHLSSSAPFP